MAKAKPIPDLTAEDAYAEAAAKVVSVRAAELAAHDQGVLETGDIARAVPTVAERLRADLLVLDRAPWDGAHLSTDAYAIIRSSPCPVLRL